MNFGVSDKEMAGTIEKMEGGKVSQTFLISNEPLYINHFNSSFEEIWKNGIDANAANVLNSSSINSNGFPVHTRP